MFMASNRPYQDSIWDGTAIGAGLGSAAGVGAAYMMSGSTKNVTKQIHDADAFNQAKANRQSGLDNLYKEVSTIEKNGQKKFGQAFNDYFNPEANQNNARKMSPDHLKELEGIGNRLGQIDSEADELLGQTFKENDYQRSVTEKQKTPRKLTGKRAAVGAGVGLLGGSIIGASMDAINK